LRVPSAVPATDPATDPRRWLTLAIAIISAFIVVLDNTVLNVAIPTILRDFHTTLPTLEWVLTGYALTFATLLIIGGRLGDIYGHRRIFVVGVALFGVGSLLASESRSVAELILGEAIIEGIGASLMLPATLAILSSTFKGRERGTAFAAWGATAGVAVACGPVVGGILTSDYSWRWSFRINVIVAPLAVLGAMMFMIRGERAERRITIDIPGACLIAVGMFCLVFGLSEGGAYGWITPVKDFTLAGHLVWPATRAVSFIPLLILFAVLVLVAFYFVERRTEARGRDPLFEFGHFRLKSYRYGLLTGLVISMGQLGLSFVLPVYLQSAKHLSAKENGLWLVPTGLFVIVGAQVGGRLIRRVGTTRVVRIGLIIYASGILLIVRAISPSMTFLQLLPGLALYGTGVGLALAQLTNVVLSEIPPESSGVASGSNTTVRQVGSALGVAVIGSLLTAQTISHTLDRLHASNLPEPLKARAVAGVRLSASNYAPPHGIDPVSAHALSQLLAQGVTSGTKLALVFAIVVVLIGTGLSFLIPVTPPPERVVAPLAPVEVAETLTPIEPEPEVDAGTGTDTGTDSAPELVPD
jgi:EmrB/QacA subfamily drug resistance transporter